MSRVYLRADDFELSNILDYYIEREIDAEYISILSNDQPTLLVGSRGTGKTMLMRVTEKRLHTLFSEKRVLPVYLSLASSTIVDIRDFRRWVLHKILIYLESALRCQNLKIKGKFLKKIASVQENPILNKLDEYINELAINELAINEFSSTENEYDGDTIIDDVDVFKLFIEELCTEFNIKKIVILFDEACQSFNPLQQRAFFDLFKDLRSPKIVCKASVYPGLVSFGNFQQSHDITNKITIERKCDSQNYVENMRKIVEVYFKENYKSLISTGDLLNCLIYCATGNPRFLIKTIELALGNTTKLKTENTKNTLKNYYRNELWQEHRKLPEKYSGHTHIIEWGDDFISNLVINELNGRNENNEKTSIYFGVETKSPSAVIHALKILEYSGIISLDAEAIRYRSFIYNRYSINIGMYLTKSENFSTNDYKDLVENLSPQNYMTYNKNSLQFNSMSNLNDISDSKYDQKEIIDHILLKSLSELELSKWIKEKLVSNGYTTIKSILTVDKKKLQEIYRIGDVRSSNIMNEAYNSILEYISG